MNLKNLKKFHQKGLLATTSKCQKVKTQTTRINRFPERDVPPVRPQVRPDVSKYSESFNFSRNPED